MAIVVDPHVLLHLRPASTDGEPARKGGRVWAKRDILLTRARAVAFNAHPPCNGGRGGLPAGMEGHW